jgi:hypothetical protein
MSCSSTCRSRRPPPASPRSARVGPYAGVHDVYDLSVAGQHRTFIAGGFVVHNKSYQPETTTGVPMTGGEPTTTGTTGATGTTGTTTDTTGTTTGTTADTASGPFGCGPDLECMLGADYCETGSGGFEPKTTYGCRPIPAECAATPDCTCLVELLGAQDCTGDPGTGVTVMFYFP